jgi:hypothetical protein
MALMLWLDGMMMMMKRQQRCCKAGMPLNTVPQQHSTCTPWIMLSQFQLTQQQLLPTLA